jgi:predicted Zn-dependent protease
MSKTLKILGVATLAVLAACQANPITGRQQFLALTSESEAMQGSAAAYAQMMGDLGKKKKIEAGTPRAAKVQEITDKLIAQAIRYRPDSKQWRWEVQVIDDPQTVNAFCMAGGKMAIYTGIWEKLKATDDEVAMVMGHEISHALANHVQERMSIVKASSAGLAVLGAALGSREHSGLAMSGAAAAAVFAIQYPNSRESESEADQIGIELAARAGYDPKAAVSLWDKMGKLGGRTPEFLSTHPSPEHRKERLQELGAKVEPYYLAAKANPIQPERYVNLPVAKGGIGNERAVPPAMGANERVVKPAPTSSTQ